MDKDFKYRDKEYFEPGVLYKFRDIGTGQEFISDVYYEGAYYWTTKRNIKATTIPCKKL